MRQDHETFQALFLPGFRGVSQFTLYETHQEDNSLHGEVEEGTQEHRKRTMLINISLGEEYRQWYGWPEHTSFGRSPALGEYIVELCEEPIHDEWLDAAKDAYLKWKAERGHDKHTAA